MIQLELMEKRQETGDVTTFIFKTPKPMTWEAGQYMHYILPHEEPDERGIERWFTISSAPHEKDIHLTTRFAKKSSSFKKKLFSLKKGDLIEVEGPGGDFVIADSKPFIFIAGGIGITPFRSILADLDAKKTPIQGTLLYANRTQDIVFKKELDELAQKHEKFNVRYIIDPKRIEANTIKEAAASMRAPIYYISGPAPMIPFFMDMLANMGIKDEDTRRDDFPGYTWPV